jgi:hypothetical protein
MPTGKERQNYDRWRGLAESGTPKIKSPTFHEVLVSRALACGFWALLGLNPAG